MKNLHHKKILFTTVAFLFWFPQFTYIPIFSPYLDSLGASYSVIGIILGSYGLTQLLFRLPIGIISDLLERRKLFLIFGMISSTISCLLYIVTEYIIWILIARSLAGVAAATWVIFTVIYPAFYEENKIHHAMGSLSFIIVLGQFVGMFISGFIVNLFGVKGPFIVGFIASLIGLLLSIFIYEPRETKVERKPIRIIGLIKVVKNKRLLKISFISIIAHGILFSTMFGFTSTYALVTGFSESDLTWIVSSFMIPHALAAIFFSKRAVIYIGEWKTLKLSFLVTSLFLLLIPVINNQYLFLLLHIIGGFSLGIIFPVLLGMSIEKIEEEKRATAMGAYQSIYSIGILTFPYLTGVFISGLGIEFGFYLLSGLSIIVTIIIARWGKNENKRLMLKAGNE